MTYTTQGYGDERTWPRPTGHPIDPRTDDRDPIGAAYEQAQATAASSADLMALKADGDIVYADLQVKHGGEWLDLDRAHDVLRLHVLAGRYDEASVLAQDMQTEIVRYLARGA
jgi:hypothetical protein